MRPIAKFGRSLRHSSPIRRHILACAEYAMQEEIEREEERERAMGRIPPRPAPGACRWCGKYIGRGIVFHERKCAERQEE